MLNLIINKMQRDRSKLQLAWTSFPGVSIQWGGQREQSKESVGEPVDVGFGIAMFCHVYLAC